MRTHGNLDKDQELNDAAWEASRGAVVGAAKVGDSSPSNSLMLGTRLTERAVGSLFCRSWSRGVPVQPGIVSRMTVGNQPVALDLRTCSRGLTFQFKV